MGAVIECMFAIAVIFGSAMIGYLIRVLQDDHNDKQVRKIVKAINDDKEKKKKKEEQKQADINRIVSAIQEEKISNV